MGIGLVTAWLGFSTRREATAVEQLPAFASLTALRQANPSGQVGLEGKISENNQIFTQRFVAYIREVYEGEECRRDDDGNRDCESVWRENGRETPPLWLDLSDGRVRVVNDDYHLQYPTTWQDQERLIDYQTQRYMGLEIGSPVFVKGQLTPNGETSDFQAEFVAGVDRAGYLAGQRQEAMGLFLFGGIFGGVGLILLVIFVALVLRS
jgi:hypothetical protein